MEKASGLKRSSQRLAVTSRSEVADTDGNDWPALYRSR